MRGGGGRAPIKSVPFLIIATPLYFRKAIRKLAFANASQDNASKEVTLSYKKNKVTSPIACVCGKVKSARASYSKKNNEETVSSPTHLNVSMEFLGTPFVRIMILRCFLTNWFSGYIHLSNEI